jgi:hypothetical protein
MKKLFAMVFELGWAPEGMVAGKDGKLVAKRDYKSFHEWVIKYGYLKKPLNRYTYNELPKLVSQFEMGPYKSYLNNRT